MLKLISKLVPLLFKNDSKTHPQELTVKPDETRRLKRELSESQHALLGARKQIQNITEQSNLWMQKSATLQDKLSASQNHVKVLDGVLEESNKTIEALELALSQQETEKAEGLQSYINELEAEMDEAIELINSYGIKMGKA